MIVDLHWPVLGTLVEALHGLGRDDPVASEGEVLGDQLLHGKLSRLTGKERNVPSPFQLQQVTVTFVHSQVSQETATVCFEKGRGNVSAVNPTEVDHSDQRMLMGQFAVCR